MPAGNYRELSVWQKAMESCKEIYTFCEMLPREETYGLVAQLKRTAISLPSNIAEGSARDSDREFLRYIAIMFGSLAEAETQILLAQELGYVKNAEANKILTMLDELGRIARGLQNSLKKKAKLEAV